MEAAGAGAEFVEAARQGVDLGLTGLPPRFEGKNYGSVNEHLDAVCKEIDRLVSLGKVEAVDHVPYIVNSLGAVTKKDTGKVRVIVDCTKSGLNAHLSAPPMALPTIRDAARLIQPGFWMAKFDLSDGFLHLPVRTDQCDLLGFRHPVSGQYFRYRYMCFGLKCAPFIFQAAMQDVMRLARQRGINLCLAYIDDWFVAARSKEDCERQMSVFTGLAAELGWQVNAKKTEGPVTQLEYLGLALDSEQLTVSIPASKATKATKRIDSLLAAADADPRAQVLTRELASAAGLLTHLAWVSPGAAARLRGCWNAIAVGTTCSTAGRHDTIWAHHATILTDALRADLSWWIAHLRSSPVRRLWVTENGTVDVWAADLVTSAFDVPRYCAVITTDAAGVGWGSTLDGAKRWAAAWTDRQSTCSSNWRETKAVSLALRLYAQDIAGKRVLVRVDNTAAVAYTNRKHGRATRLSEIARDIHALELEFGFEAVAVHIPGKDNTEADELSRLSQPLFAKRQLQPALLRHLEIRLGHRLTAVMEATDAALKQFASASCKDAVLWCPGPHEFVTCIHAALDKCRQRNGGLPHFLLVPDAPHAPWWGLTSGHSLVQRWQAGTTLFVENLSIPVPNSSASPLFVPRKIGCDWIVITFSEPTRVASRKRKVTC